MAFLSPAWLLLGLLAIPLVLLYMLRLRRREVPVSSTLLWQQLLQDREANAPWQRLRRNLFLLLQLLLLTLLVLALARPFLPSESLAGGNMVVLLDGSASMLATDVAPTRFVEATAQVEGLIAAMGGDDQMTLILVGATPSILASASRDPGQLRQALASAQATAAPADWEAAVALAAGAVQGFDEGRVILIGDGGLPAELPSLPAPVTMVPVGTEDANLALTALATRDTIAGPQAYANVSNYGSATQQALVSLRADGRLLSSQRIGLDGGENQGLVWSLPDDAQMLEASLVGEDDDYLAQDNTAWAVRDASGRGRILLLGEGNRFLETVLGVMPDVELVRTANVDGVELGDADLIVYDGVPLPAAGPSTDALVIDPVATQDGQGPLRVGGLFTDTAVVQVAEHELLRFVDWNDISVRQAKRIEAPWARALVLAEGGPLLLAGEWRGQRVIILTFRLQDSDLPLQIAFPVLMANIVNWLRPGRVVNVNQSLSVGESVTLRPVRGAATLTIRGPGERLWTLRVDEEAVAFGETQRPGLYQIADSGDQDSRQLLGAFAVNMFAPSESAIAPVETVALSQEPLEQNESGAVGRRELWPWLAAVAVILLALEWWGYQTGWRLPPTLGHRWRRIG